MEFKSSTATFAEKSGFRDVLTRFVSEEATIFTPEKEEATAASFDRTAEKFIRFSADKNKVKAKEEKITSKQYHEKEKVTENPLNTRTSGKPEQLSANSNENKKSISKEKKKAAAKTAVANVFRGKADMSNDLVSEKTTGDALADGNRGLMKTFVTAINPMTYLKKWLGKVAMLVAPYLLIFISIAAVLVVVISLFVSIAKPIADVGNALSAVMEFFTGEGGGLRNTSFSSDEIDAIVEKSGATEEQETVIRFALSKVGYPYSQDARTSGSAYDCSSLAYYSWESAGTDISYGSGYPPTAAEGARMLKTDGKEVSAASLQPGDLVYYGGSSNGRYMGIYHVAIYVGNGMAVEALNEKYGVVYQKLRTNNACMVCRPNL